MKAYIQCGSTTPCLFLCLEEKYMSDQGLDESYFKNTKLTLIRKTQTSIVKNT